MDRSIFLDVTYKDGYSCSISSAEVNGKSYVSIVINGYYIVINCLNKKAEVKLKQWHEKEYRGENRKMPDVFKKLEIVLSDEALFEVLTEQKEAYKLHLLVDQKSWQNVFKSLPKSKHPPKPEKSFEMLKEWYHEVLYIDKQEFLRTSLDSSPELLNTFEIDVITKLSDDIFKRYISPPLRQVAPRLPDTKANKTTSKEEIANRTFYKWLIERKKALEEKKILEPVIEEVHIKDIKNWNKKTRTYFLLKFGIDQIPNFKSLSQKGKYDVIANILNCSPRKAMEYYNHSEKELNASEKESVNNYLQKLKKGT